MADSPLTEDPVIPQVVSSIAKDSVYPSSFPLANGSYAYVHGLTKRELFAAMAMQAILTGAVTRGCPAHEWVDQDMAVRCADALLKELAK